MATRTVGPGKYFKAAFTYPWNLLALFAAIGAGLLSPLPLEVWGPLVLAGELAYLGLLGTHPRFRKAVDAREHSASRQRHLGRAEESLRKILAALPDEYRRRFHDLRNRCLELRRLAARLRGADPDHAPPLDDLQVEGLDRLLWMHLRLLYSQHALGEFLRNVTAEQIQADIHEIERQLARLNEAESSQKLQAKKALEDNLQTCRERLANYQKARDNYELLHLEISRLENKIQSISEMALNRQEPEFISGQIDQVASSLVETERTISDLSFATGFSQVDEEVPSLLQRNVARETA
jgi:DNA repair exonuclease SbcCD ATPase subunit